MATNIMTWQGCLDAAKSACAHGDYATGQAQLKQALDMAADQQAPERGLAEIFHYTGWCYHAQQRFAEALRSYGRASTNTGIECATSYDAVSGACIPGAGPDAGDPQAASTKKLCHRV